MSIKEWRKWEEYWINKNLRLSCVYCLYINSHWSPVRSSRTTLPKDILICCTYTYLIKIKFINVEVKYYWTRHRWPLKLKILDIDIGGLRSSDISSHGEYRSYKYYIPKWRWFWYIFMWLFIVLSRYISLCFILSFHILILVFLRIICYNWQQIIRLIVYQWL